MGGATFHGRTQTHNTDAFPIQAPICKEKHCFRKTKKIHQPVVMRGTEKKKRKKGSDKRKPFFSVIFGNFL